MLCVQHFFVLRETVVIFTIKSCHLLIIKSVIVLQSIRCVHIVTTYLWFKYFYYCTVMHCTVIATHLHVWEKLPRSLIWSGLYYCNSVHQWKRTCVVQITVTLKQFTIIVPATVEYSSYSTVYRNILFKMKFEMKSEYCNFYRNGNVTTV